MKKDAYEKQDSERTKRFFMQNRIKQLRKYRFEKNKLVGFMTSTLTVMSWILSATFLNEVFNVQNLLTLPCLLFIYFSGIACSHVVSKFKYLIKNHII